MARQSARTFLPKQSDVAAELDHGENARQVATWMTNLQCQKWPWKIRHASCPIIDCDPAEFVALTIEDCHIATQGCIAALMNKSRSSLIAAFVPIHLYMAPNTVYCCCSWLRWHWLTKHCYFDDKCAIIVPIRWTCKKRHAPCPIIHRDPEVVDLAIEDCHIATQGFIVALMNNNQSSLFAAPVTIHAYMTPNITC